MGELPFKVVNHLFFLFNSALYKKRLRHLRRAALLSYPAGRFLFESIF